MENAGGIILRHSIVPRNHIFVLYPIQSYVLRNFLLINAKRVVHLLNFQISLCYVFFNFSGGRN